MLKIFLRKAVLFLSDTYSSMGKQASYAMLRVDMRKKNKMGQPRD
jgi:hypothetical protein